LRNLVLNDNFQNIFEIKDYESYVHRSGRTGRAGRTGVCICFYKPQELGSLLQLERNTVSAITLF